MNPHEHHLPAVVDQQQLDRLVDGELSAAERRALLSRLESDPGGWRRCALAFLEAQAWRSELGQLRGELGLTERPPEAAAGATPPPRVLTRKRFDRIGGILATAASFLLALFLGLKALDWWRLWQGSEPAAVSNFAQLGPGKLPSTQPQSPPSEAVAPPAEAWQMVTVPIPGNGPGGSESIRVPAIERERVDDVWLSAFPSAVPQEVLQALERTGHRVRQQRELLPVPLRDGRRLVVPVDRVEVRYVGGY